MSGIYGIYRYDGAPVDPQWLERMRNAMAYYGPHGGGCKIEGPVGMGHLLLEINPEDAFERQPMRCPRGLVVTSVRLDNRDALLDAFDIPSSEAPQVSDGQLVSLAFDRWGEEVCTHLEGDWALAAWDAKQRRLLLARDVFGMGALYYYQGKGFIAFASSMKALLALPGIVKEPDLLHLAEVLVSWQDEAPDITSYKGFRAALGARLLTIGSDGRKIERRYWSHEGREPLRYRHDQEYEEAFLDKYTKAVKSCLRSQKPIAAELSAGRDSGSVVTLAASMLASQGRPLTAYTSVPFFAPDGADKTRLGNEWELAHATATMAGQNVRHVAIDARDYKVIEGLEHFLDLHDGPSHTAANHYWLKAVIDACTQAGTGVLLTGQKGNFTVSWDGNGSVALALLQRDPALAFRLFLHGEPNLWKLIKRQAIKPLWMPGLRIFRRLRNHSTTPWQAYSALNPQMGRELDIDGRMREAGYDPTFTFTPLQDIRNLYFQQADGTAACLYAEMDAWHSISSPDPTANLVLVEFLLRVPDDQFYRQGQRSSLFKQAFRNRMPTPVLYSTRKGLQAADLGHRILRELPAFEEALQSLESVPAAREMLDLPLMQHCLSDVIAKVTPESTENAECILVRGLAVGIFLRRFSLSWR